MTHGPESPNPPTSTAPAEPDRQALPAPAPTDGGGSETEGWWPDRWGDFNSKHRWASRLAFPLMAAAVLLAWQGVRVSSGEQASPLPAWGWWLLAAGTALGGLVMVRVRHGSVRR